MFALWKETGRLRMVETGETFLIEYTCFFCNAECEIEIPPDEEPPTCINPILRKQNKITGTGRMALLAVYGKTFTN